MKLTVFDYWDKILENPKPLTLDRKGPLAVGDTLEFNDVTYKVERRFNNPRLGDCAVLKMVRYRIPDTATQFVHKCPAKKNAMDRMSREDLINLEQEQGKKATERMQQGRVKMGGIAPVVVCPFCKCEFWKKQVLIPEQVQVKKMLRKKKLKKRG